MAPVRLALIHSPLVGPSMWRLVAASLAAQGVSAEAVDYGGVSAPDWYEGAASRIARAISGDGPLMLGLHSGAGALAPCLATRLGDRLAGLIFVDALMPHPGRSWFETAPPSLARRLRRLARDGILPPWDEWFGAEGLVKLVPDAAVRAAFCADLPRLPIAYLEAPAPAGDDLRTVPAAYLQLSDGYAAEAEAAEMRGWAVRREPSHHLAMLTEPARLVQMLAEMTRKLGPA